MPRQVTKDYLQTTLGVEQDTAGKLLVALRLLSLIDDDGRTTPLANGWRHDESYRDSCGKMLASIYPDDLQDALPPPSPDLDAVTGWFSRNCEIGEVAARQRATTYVLLAAGDVTGESSASGQSRLKLERPQVSLSKGKRRSTPSVTITPEASSGETGESSLIAKSYSGIGAGIAINLNIQLALPESSDPAVYDALFQAIKKHLVDA